MKSKISSRKRKIYINKFGFSPHCRVAIHCGPVIVGEMGDIKQEISFLGGTVNTTSRIKDACNSCGTEFLISKDLLDKIKLETNYRIKNFRDISLRGKEKPISLFNIELNS